MPSSSLSATGKAGVGRVKLPFSPLAIVPRGAAERTLGEVGGTFCSIAETAAGVGDLAITAVMSASVFATAVGWALDTGVFMGSVVCGSVVVTGTAEAVMGCFDSAFTVCSTSAATRLFVLAGCDDAAAGITAGTFN